MSTGIIVTRTANDELPGPRGDGYRNMPKLSSAARAGTPDEVGDVGALLMGTDGASIPGSDFQTNASVTASYYLGELAPKG